MSIEKKLLSWRWWLGLSHETVLLSPPKFTITAIVPAFNEEASIAETVLSLLKQTYRLDAIVVVDDCSTDATGKIAGYYPRVTVLRTPQNRGTKSQAENFALDGITTELFVTVDADTILKPDAVYEAMRYFNDTACEVVCGTVVPQVRSNFWERGRLVEYLYAQAVMKPAQNHHGLVMVASGCFSIFKTETVRRFGGFNERTLAEDMDLTWEIQNDGGRVYFASKAVCYPVDPPTGAIYCKQLDRWYRGFMQNLKVRNFRIFPNKRAMAYMVYGYLVWFAFSALLVPGFLYGMTGNVLQAIWMAFLINAIFVWLPALVYAWRLNVFRDALGGLLPFLLLPYLNLYLYVRAFIAELIMGQTLTTWQKGH